MTYTLIGLGNPGNEYDDTRHNTGRMLVEMFAKRHDFSDWKEQKVKKSLEAKGEIGKNKVIAVLPETFMNNSGKAALLYVKSPKEAERLVVVYDELDLPLGTFKISFGRGSGGHRGLDSIMRSLKTRDFVRVRVGVSPTTPSGKLKKPSGEKAVIDFILGKFKPTERDMLKKETKKILEAIEMILTEGREVAMGEYN